MDEISRVPNWSEIALHLWGYNLTIDQLLSNDSPVVSFSNNTIDKAFIQNYYETHRDLLDAIIQEKDKQIAYLKEELENSRKQMKEFFDQLTKKI